MRASADQVSPPARKTSPSPAVEPAPEVSARIESLQGAGSPLPDSARAYFEPRFGQDFSGVRVHSDSSAAEAAEAAEAKAFTTGRDIVFGPGQFAFDTSSGRKLLAHELAHVVQQGTLGTGPQRAGTPDAGRLGECGESPTRPVMPVPLKKAPDPSRLWRATDEELTGAATYPTADERGDIQEILNPQQQQAIAQGTTVKAVTNPTGFQTDMTNRLDVFINSVLPSAKARQASTVMLGVSELTDLADIAQPKVNDYYGPYLSAAKHSTAEQASRAAYKLREHIHEVPTTQNPQTDSAALDWVGSRMHVRGGDLLRRYNVLSGDASARDQLLFNQVRNHIFNLRTNDLRTIILFHPGYESMGEAYIQRYIVPQYRGQTAQDTKRSGRWVALGTTIHEMLHAVTHENFTAAVHGLEESGIAVEGFTEYFTRPVYDSLVKSSRSDAALRISIEGAPGRSITPKTRSGNYDDYLLNAEKILKILGGNEENLKVAYFLGHVEYLGLGGWSESEAATRRYPGNTLGVAALLTDNGEGLFHVDYGRVVLGRTGAFQLQVGGEIDYLTQGERLGVGGTAALRYSWPNVYIEAGMGATVSASLTQPFDESVRLDLLPRVEAGVRIGIVRVGAGAYLLMPVAGGPVSERTLQLASGFGISLDL